MAALMWWLVWGWDPGVSVNSWVSTPRGFWLWFAAVGRQDRTSAKALAPLRLRKAPEILS